VSLTTGRGPFGKHPAGRFVGAVYVEPFQRRVRGLVGDDEVVDSDDVLLVHRPGHPPTYAFPAGDVTAVESAPEEAAPGYVAVAWDAVEQWFEELEPVFMHPRNPYHRIDILRTDRPLHVTIGGVVVVDTIDTLVLHETALPPRLYVARAHLLVDLETSTTTSYCPYKGTASYWSFGGVTDVAWSYEDPLPESRPIAGHLSFYEER
jgi:uncharacterized protein (DUF427 family)